MDEVRGGSRGGLNKFSWDTIKEDRNRICYLGNSVKAPVGRWQTGKDLNWFQKLRSERQDMPLQGVVSSVASSIKNEQDLLREKEKETMANALLHGFGNSTSTNSSLSPNLIAATLELFENKNQKLSSDDNKRSTSPSFERVKSSARTSSIPKNYEAKDTQSKVDLNRKSSPERKRPRNTSIDRTNTRNKFTSTKESSARCSSSELSKDKRSNRERISNNNVYSRERSLERVPRSKYNNFSSSTNISRDKPAEEADTQHSKTDPYESSLSERYRSKFRGRHQASPRKYFY